MNKNEFNPAEVRKDTVDMVSALSLIHELLHKYRVNDAEEETTDHHCSCGNHGCNNCKECNHKAKENNENLEGNTMKTNDNNKMTASMYDKYTDNHNNENIGGYEIKEDGEFHQFEGGAIRRTKTGKGRYDLIVNFPASYIAESINYMFDSNETIHINPGAIIASAFYGYSFDNKIQDDVTIANMARTIILLMIYHYDVKDHFTEYDSYDFDDDAELENAVYTMYARLIKELALHYEKGALKYGDGNCEKGIPVFSFIDSGRRHLIQYLLGETDENHFIAAVWNFWMAIWTIEKTYYDIQSKHYSELDDEADEDIDDCDSCEDDSEEDDSDEENSDEEESEEPDHDYVFDLLARIGKARNEEWRKIFKDKEEAEAAETAKTEEARAEKLKEIDNDLEMISDLLDQIIKHTEDELNNSRKHENKD